MAGVAVPLHACEHYALITKPIDGMSASTPILGDHDGCLYIREEVGGLLAGSFEPDAKPVTLEDLPVGFSFDLLEEDWDHFEPMMRNALHRVPALETAEVRVLLNGPESFTADNNFMLGESAELGGFFVGCGMNSVGDGERRWCRKGAGRMGGERRADPGSLGSGYSSFPAFSK